MGRRFAATGAWMLAAIAGLGVPCGSALAEERAPQRMGSPQRVVSMYLCTDQMAMLVAAPGQLLSVSFLAADPSSSALAAEAKAGGYAVNHGLAEEIFLMRPDLVIAGTYTTRATVGLLRKLGIRVEEFAPETSFDDIRANLRRMGDLLGQSARAEEVVADLDRRLAELTPEDNRGATVATYYANSYTAGGDTLVDAVIGAAGLTNIPAELGHAGTARLPLEMLVMANPDLLIIGDREHSAPALAQQGFGHPAFRAQAARSGEAGIPSNYMSCGTPLIAEAAHLLSQAAKSRQTSPTRTAPQ